MPRPETAPEIVITLLAAGTLASTVLWGANGLLAAVFSYGISASPAKNDNRIISLFMARPFRFVISKTIPRLTVYYCEINNKITFLSKIWSELPVRYITEWR